MVLTDREIQVALATQQITIDPAPNELAFSSTSLDLTLANNLQVWKEHKAKGVEQIIISPATRGYVFNDVAKEHTDAIQMDEKGYVLEPGVLSFRLDSGICHPSDAVQNRSKS